MSSIHPFLTFASGTEAIVNHYVELFPHSRLINLTRYGIGMRLPEGALLNATFELNGMKFMAMDIGEPYAPPSLSWGISLFMNCADEAEFDAVFAGLAAGGSVMMGPEPVMHLRKVAWVTDQFGVTWQLVWS